MTCSAKQNHLATWSHANSTNIRQHIRAPTPTILGHLDHQRKNKLSTKLKPLTKLETELDIKPISATSKCNKVCINIYEEIGRMHTDQTGKFPIKLTQGYQHLLIAYVYDTNTILCRKLKRKDAEELQVTCDDLHKCLTARGYKPIFYQIDNEIAKSTQELLGQTFGAMVKIVPPTLPQKKCCRASHPHWKEPLNLHT